MNQSDLIEGVHNYINKDGYIGLTEKYHLEKGSCCVGRHAFQHYSLNLKKTWQEL